MVKSYCVKEKKQTECVQPSGYKKTKNGRTMFWCMYCASCGIKMTRFVKSRKLNSPSEGAGVVDTVAGTG